MVSNTLGWAVGDGGTILKWNGDKWERWQSPTTTNLKSVYALQDRHWAVGENGTIIYGSEDKWNILHAPSNSTLFSVHGSSQENVWASGEESTFMRWNGISWSHSSAGLAINLNSIFIKELEGWAVSNKGVILHYNGSFWSIEPQITDINLRGVTVGGGYEWAVGDSGITLIRAREMWSSLGNPTGNNLHSIFVADGGEVWVVGANGTILHRSGLKDPLWKLYNSPVKVDLYDVSMPSKDFGFIVGDGVILQWDGVAWKTYDKPITLAPTTPLVTAVTEIGSKTMLQLTLIIVGICIVIGSTAVWRRKKRGERRHSYS